MVENEHQYGDEANARALIERLKAMEWSGAYLCLPSFPIPLPVKADLLSLDSCVICRHQPTERDHSSFGGDARAKARA
jgi:hypothetical protein